MVVAAELLSSRPSDAHGGEAAASILRTMAKLSAMTSKSARNQVRELLRARCFRKTHQEGAVDNATGFWVTLSFQPAWAHAASAVAPCDDEFDRATEQEARCP